MPIPQVSPTARGGLLRDDVYLRLRDLIVDGTLAPGEQLHDLDLAGWLGVSRTPVREALLRLCEGGLVVSAPGHSTKVTPLDDHATRDARSVVVAMHTLVVSSAVPLLTIGDLDLMHAANRRFARAIDVGDVDGALAADDELHGIPLAAVGNAAAQAVLEQFMPLLRRVERAHFASLAGRRSVDLHQVLIDRCAAGDLAGAQAAAFETWETLDPLPAT